MDPPKRHHTVPQFLLKNFAFGKKRNQLWVYDKWTDRIYQSTINNIFVGKNFYDGVTQSGETISLEAGLARLESGASKVIRELLRFGKLSALTIEQHATLATYVASQKLRTAGCRESLEEIDKALEAQLLKSGVDPTTVRLCNPGSDPASAPKFRRMEQHELKLSSLLFLLESLPAVASKLAEMHWILFQTSREELWISDNPICVDNQLDYGQMGKLGLCLPGIEIYLPLSRDYCLGMLCPKLYSSLEAQGTLAKENVEYLNCLQLVRSSRFLYSYSDSFDCVQAFLNQHPEYRKPQRIAAA